MATFCYGLLPCPPYALCRSRARGWEREVKGVICERRCSVLCCAVSVRSGADLAGLCNGWGWAVKPVLLSLIHVTWDEEPPWETLRWRPNPWEDKLTVERIGTAHGTERLDAAVNQMWTLSLGQIWQVSIRQKNTAPCHCHWPRTTMLAYQKLHEYLAKLKENLKSDPFLSAK